MTGWRESLGALRDWAAQSQPVFVCGQERSGTSALLLALARHPALFGVPDVFETFIFHQARALLVDPPQAMQQGYLRGPAQLAALRTHLARLGGGQSGTLDDDDLIRAFFAHAATAVYPGRRPLEKTPAHVYSLPRVLRLFPQARVLACVREPTEVVLSYQRRLQREQALGKPRAAWAWLDRTDAMLVSQFRKIDRAIREAARLAPGQVFRVPYGWLTADPENALAAICAFVGEPFEPAMLRPRAGARERVDARLSLPLGAAPASVGDDAGLDPARAAKLRHDTHALTQRWRVPGIVAAEPA
jgi:hypothetical protein